MSSDSELLQRACERILELDRPAFIKDGALRYVVVNEAFARLHGTPRQAFEGRVSGDFPNGPENDEADLRQRRSLIFGSDEVVSGLQMPAGGRVDLHVERFLTDDDQAFLFGFLAVENNAQLATQRASDLPSIDISAPVTDGRPRRISRMLVPPRISWEPRSIFSMPASASSMRITSSSRAMIHFREYFSSSGMSLAPGVSLRRLMEQLYDGEARPDLGDGQADRARREWVDERLRVYAQDHSQSMVALPDGRWLRSVNKRLPNGWLVMLRQDVTEFKIQELRLGKQIEEAEIFRAALENLPVAVFLRDSQRRLLYANAQYELILGGDRQRYIGRTDEEMFPAAAERFRTENENLLANGGVLEKTSEIILADDKRISALTSLCASPRRPANAML